MKLLLRLFLGSFFVAVACVGESVQAQNSRIENTPILIQDGFGPFGENLPNDGLEYCCPTATTMGLFWLGSNGYSMLAPSTAYDPMNPADVATALNIDRAIAGLMNTSPGGGTKAGTVSALQTYFGLKGLSSSASVTSQAFPTSAEIGATLTGFNFTVLSVGWYHTNDPNNWVKKGGHCIALVNYVDGSPNSTITIHNPMSETPQSPMILEITDAPPANSSLNGNYQLQQGILSSPTVVPVLQGMFTFNPGALPSPGVFDDFDISSNGGRTINTNGATLTAPARIVGTGSLTKNGAGSLILETDLAGGNTFSGGLTVNEGSLVATQNSGTPAGTGDITLNGGTLSIAPAGIGTDLTLQVSGSGSTFSYGGGTLAIARGSYDELSVTLGGNTDGTTANIIRNFHGSLLVAASGGLSSLGTTEKLLVNGSGSNLPPLYQGIVLSSIVGQDNDANLSGDFLTYDPTNGFSRFTGYVSSNTTPLGPPNTSITTVYENVTDQTLAENEAAYVHALKVTNSTISGSTGDSLHVGAENGDGVAGIILNGGVIDATVLDFSSNNAVIYVNASGGSISSDIQGSAGLVVSGPGTLRISGDNSYTGGTTINSGTLMVLSTTGAGNVVAKAGAFLGGTGSVEGELFLSGSINPGDPLQANAAGLLTINGNTTFLDGSDYQWELTTLTDSQTGTAGSDWDFLQINGDLDLPSFADDLFAQVTLQFDSLFDPNSGNAFWNEDRSWEIAAVTGSISNFAVGATSLDISNPRWAEGRFALALDSSGHQILLTYTIPEPSSAVLVGLGALLLLRQRRQRRFLALHQTMGMREEKEQDGSNENRNKRVSVRGE